MCICVNRERDVATLQPIALFSPKNAFCVRGASIFESAPLCSEMPTFGGDWEAVFECVYAMNREWDFATLQPFALFPPKNVFCVRGASILESAPLCVRIAFLDSCEKRDFDAEG